MFLGILLGIGHRRGRLRRLFLRVENYLEISNFVILLMRGPALDLTLRRVAEPGQ